MLRMLAAALVLAVLALTGCADDSDDASQAQEQTVETTTAPGPPPTTAADPFGRIPELVREVQPEGRNRLDVAAWVRGRGIAPGQRLE